MKTILPPGPDWPPSAIKAGADGGVFHGPSLWWDRSFVKPSSPLPKASTWPWADFTGGSKAGAAVAVVATARKLAVLFYRAMTRGLEYVERGLAQYEAAYRKQSERHLRK